jgi:hypothetical protein
MARDYRAEIHRTLMRQRAAVNTPAKAFERATAARLPASILSVSDISDVIGDALAEQQREILQHVGRMLKLIEIKRSSEDVRAGNLHRRITILESEVRRLQKASRIASE